MDAHWTDERRAIADVAERFARDRLAPHAAEWDEKKVFPVDVMREAANLGLAAIYTKPDHGGTGLGRVEAALIFEALSKGCVATAAFISIHNMVTWMVDSFGTEEQRGEWVPRLCTMDLVASYCLTEPGSGSDAAGLATRAERDGTDYVLNGTKQFISGAGVSDVYLVMARTGDQSAGGISTFLIPKDTPGLSFGKLEKKLGWNAQPTGQVIFEECRVPGSALLGGEEGVGFKFAMKGLDGGRVNIAACSLGPAAAALDEATYYAKERKQFGKPIADNQAIQFKLADMATHLHASRLMLFDAAEKLDARDPQATRTCAMAKRFVTDVCYQIVDDALQIHGGYGYTQDYPIERWLRDLRVHRILEGTNEIMRVILARQMLAD